MTAIAVIGTCDTKLEELLFLRSQILEHENTSVVLIDVGRKPVENAAITVKQGDVLKHYKAAGGDVDLSNMPRGEVIKHMIASATPVVKELFESSKISGIVSAGGSGGTSLSSAVMRDALPIGFPKLIVSTVASGDTGPIVGETDISLTYSVVDISGSNTLLENIFTNAAGAIVGMANAYQKRLSKPSASAKARKRVGITMFGVTTPCVDKARQVLESKYNCEVYVFHATGHGGQAMERLVREKGLDAVLDISTTEVCDHLMGGNMSAGPNRLEAAAAAGIPYVLSVGACDMVNFGPRKTVPEKYNERLLFEHNPVVTLMRTSEAECGQVGAFIADKLTKFAADPSKVQVMLPMGGVSIIATPGAPFADAKADQALFAAVESGLKGSQITLVKDERDINNEGFAAEIAERLGGLL